MPTKKVFNSMVQQHFLSEQSRFSKLFATLRIGKALRNRHFQIVRSFQFGDFSDRILAGLRRKELVSSFGSDRGADLLGKDVVYRFLNQSSFSWRRFLQTVSLRIARHFESLISSKRMRVFIVDDSVLSRNRSKKAERLARVFDHSTGKITEG
ncbi:transposase [Paenibacillus sp. FSL H3-0457]|uniref:transposase n=1 Tax=Paenibacillus sp. FSL H3-0457 TaxID=2921430 RepID=UPI0030EDC0FF